MNDASDQIEYSEYRDEHGTVALLYAPGNHRAWIRSTATVPVRP